MKQTQLNKIERILIGAMVVLCVILFVGVTLLLKNRQGKTKKAESSSSGADYSEELTESISFYPKKVVLGEKLPVAVFQDEDGKNVSLEEEKGNIVVLTYWASWCKYCKSQFESLDGLSDWISQFDDVSCYLVDKLDGEKETKKQAQDYLKENNITLPCLYDENLTAYDAMGIQIVPTTLILDTEGNLSYCYAGVLESKEELESMIAMARDGSDAATLQFVEENMMSDMGGMYTEYKENEGEVPSGHDVLSESQGLLMEYAAETGNEELFSNAYDYIKENMYENSLPLWVDTDKEEISTNALLDDLRILHALSVMQEETGLYREDVKDLMEAIVIYNTKDQNPVDFYDFSLKEKANQFTLCYGDFTVLKQISSEIPAADKLYERTLALVEGGYIGTEFPFYYNCYFYEDQSYDTSSLNMAEALYTVYHLAQVGKVQEDTLAWIRTHMEENGIYARYDVDGEVTVGYDYESPAIYALVGLIAKETGDEELMTSAVSHMEAWRVFDTSDPADGAIGTEGLESMMSYDQCMALLFYGKKIN